MGDMSLTQMQELQRELQEHYKATWEGISPAIGRNKLLWMIGEAGEVIDILKHHKPEDLMEDSPVRHHLVEELCDVLMYFNDVALCYDISPEELSRAYREKHEKNMKRWSNT